MAGRGRRTAPRAVAPAAGGSRSAPARGCGSRLRRDAFATTMVVLRGPGECSRCVTRSARGRCAIPARLGRADGAAHARAAASAPRISRRPVLARRARRPRQRLAARRPRPPLPPALPDSAVGSIALPRERPLQLVRGARDGSLATKDIDRELREPRARDLLDPDTLERRARPSSSPSRRSRGCRPTGTCCTRRRRHVVALRWDGNGSSATRLALSLPRRAGAQLRLGPGDLGRPRVAARQRRHAYATTMRGAAVAPGPVAPHARLRDDPGDARHRGGLRRAARDGHEPAAV